MPIGLKTTTPFRNKSPMKLRWPWKQSRKSEAREALADQQADLQTAIGDFGDFPTANAYAGLANPMQGLGAGNRILGMQNPFAGMGNPLAGIQTQFENKFEDIGVDTKAAELAQRQFQQNQASQLEAFKTMGMSGGQIQSMANASLQQAAQTRTDIGSQEREGKVMAAKGASQVQQMEAEAKEKKLKAGFDVDRMIRQGQFDVDKLIGATELDIDKTQREGEWKTQMSIRGGEMDLQNLNLQKEQGMLALQAGLLEGARGQYIARKGR
jgi:hypothetical protein|tara:strand:- start:1828 stop:2631 length:804 start_codon:yes stop_codon:yes gene_type:complete